ncbi:MAG: exodeoxyribonuclease VII small subunit [Chlamydiia bacterium]|nr:exodeoxyribonuclease VII small subunit [Chlamydiia bacterium]
MTQKSLSFEASFERLEQILEKLNAGNVGLDETLKLYEEASGLLNTCQERLGEAEQKIQVLIKERSGETPQMEDFSPQ